MANADFERTLNAGTKGEWWVNMGAFSQHFSRASQFNQQNSGFGLEYQLNRENSLVIGHYRNSVRETTRYLGAAWMPLALGKFKFGVLAGAADGYPEMRDSGFFPIALPLVVFETKNVGLNFTMVPSISSKVAGCVAMQLKFRFQ